MKRKEQATQTELWQQPQNSEKEDTVTKGAKEQAENIEISTKEVKKPEPNQEQNQISKTDLPVLDIGSVAETLKQNNATSPQNWEEVTVADISTPPTVTADSKTQSSTRGRRAQRIILQEERQNWFNLRASMVANYGHSSSRSAGEAANLQAASML